ncbi:hypothetical protein ABZU05_04595 [Sneathia vaginalis]|uniref:hypothetical protein n=1 Tax=Sneathia vaginalis TaxID=187101 RepID=UPI0035C71FEC
MYDTETFGANTKLGLHIPAYISVNLAVTLPSGLTTNLSFNNLKSYLAPACNLTYPVVYAGNLCI